MTLTFQGHNFVNDVLGQILLPAEKIVTKIFFSHRVAWVKDLIE